MKMDEERLTVKDCQEYTGYSRQTIHSWEKAGLISPVFLDDGLKRYYRHQIDDIVAVKGKYNGKRGLSVKKVIDKISNKE